MGWWSAADYPAGVGDNRSLLSCMEIDGWMDEPMDESVSGRECVCGVPIAVVLVVVPRLI